MGYTSGNAGEIYGRRRCTNVLHAFCSRTTRTPSRKAENSPIFRIVHWFVRCSYLHLIVDLLPDILTRLQLYSPAAYVRKFSKVGDVRDITRVSTSVGNSRSCH